MLDTLVTNMARDHGCHFLTLVLHGPRGCTAGLEHGPWTRVLCTELYIKTRKALFRGSADHLTMAALCNRAGHYIFALWFLSFFYLIFLA